MRPAQLTVVTGGLALHSSSAQLADRLKDAVRTTLSEGGVPARVRTHHLSQFYYEIADVMTNGSPEGELEALVQEVRQADAVITVSPTFQGSYSGLFKSFWDLFLPEDLEGKPVLLGGTGGSPRQSMMVDYALRPLFGHLHAEVVPTGIYATGEELARTGAVEPRVARAASQCAERVLRNLELEQAAS